MEVGDVVKLKSGGPKMTIQKISNWGASFSGESGTKNQAQCFWFDGNEQKEGVFHLNSLEVISEQEAKS